MFAAAVTLLCFFLVFYAYFGYPLVLMLSNYARTGRARAASPPLPEHERPPLTIIITCRNEERVIREKVENTLRLSYGRSTLEDALRSRPELVQLIVASDASDDGTDAIVQNYSLRGVELVRLDLRGGKEKAQRAAIAASRGEIIVFTDAKIRLNPEALDYFAAYFEDREVGAVSSVDQVESEPGQSSGEGFYVRYEMWLRALESHFLSLVGLSGSCFAVRRSLAENLATDLPSDFALLLETRRAGLRGRHAPEIVGTYKAVKTEKEEFARKVRTVLRGISTLFSRSEVMNIGRYGVFAWQVISHKLARWLVPWFFIIGSAGTLLLSARSSFFLALSVLLVLFLGFALAAYCVPSLQKHAIAKVPLFFVVSNAAVAAAWVKYLSGKRTVSWEPSAKGAA